MQHFGKFPITFQAFPNPNDCIEWLKLYNIWLLLWTTVRQHYEEYWMGTVSCFFCSWLGLDAIRTWSWFGLKPIWSLDLTWSDWTCLGFDLSGPDYSPPLSRVQYTVILSISNKINIHYLHHHQPLGSPHRRQQWTVQVGFTTCWTFLLVAPPTAPMM